MSRDSERIAGPVGRTSRFAVISRGALVALTVLAAGTAACHKRGGVITAIPVPDYTARIGQSVRPVLIFTEPSRPFVVVGVVDIRLVRQTHKHYVPSWLVQGASELQADAVLPPGPEVERRLTFDSIDPYRPFYVYEDGRTAVIQGRAIRYADGSIPVPGSRP